MAADFSYFSSPESDDAAVDAIISQAMDLSLLEQIAALNTSHLSDFILPTDLETRFRKLKSFPGSDPNPGKTPPIFDSEKESSPRSLNRCMSRPTSSPTWRSADEKEIFPPAEQKRRKESDAKLRTGFGSPHRATDEKEISPPVKSKAVKDSDSKLRSGFGSSPSFSHISPIDPPSPPRQMCCFGCSPKRVSKKKGNRDIDFGLGLDDLRKNNEIILDWCSSLKEQQRMMKRAFKEEEKVSGEVENVVQLMKKASSRRLDVSAIDELLSDDETIRQMDA